MYLNCNLTGLPGYALPPHLLIVVGLVCEGAVDGDAQRRALPCQRTLDARLTPPPGSSSLVLGGTPCVLLSGADLISKSCLFGLAKGPIWRMGMRVKRLGAVKRKIAGAHLFALFPALYLAFRKAFLPTCGSMGDSVGA